MACLRSQRSGSSLLVQRGSPSMIERQTGILISTSSSGQLDSPAMSAYISSKVALSKFHELLFIELEAESPNTTTFAVHPGFIWTGIGTRDGEVNDAQMQHPAMQELFSMFGSMEPKTMKMQTPELCADTMVALAADPAYKVLTGRHINATQSLPSVLNGRRKRTKVVWARSVCIWSISRLCDGDMHSCRWTDSQETKAIYHPLHESRMGWSVVSSLDKRTELECRVGPTYKYLHVHVSKSI